MLTVSIDDQQKLACIILNKRTEKKKKTNYWDLRFWSTAAKRVAKFVNWLPTELVGNPRYLSRNIKRAIEPIPIFRTPHILPWKKTFFSFCKWVWSNFFFVELLLFRLQLWMCESLVASPPLLYGISIVSIHSRAIHTHLTWANWKRHSAFEYDHSYVHSRFPAIFFFSIIILFFFFNLMCWHNYNISE